MDLNLNKNMSARRNLTKHNTGPYEPRAAQGVCTSPSPPPPPTFWQIMFFFFIVSDSKKKLRFTIACAKKNWTKQATYSITRLNLVSIIGTKQQSNSIFHRNYGEYGKWEYHLISRYIYIYIYFISNRFISN